MAKISIIVPIYNEEKYIENCLESILQSDYNKDEMEVFLVDGGSQDKTIDIIKEYQRKYPFFQLLSNPNKTPPYAMNIGIKASQGDYIIRLDAHAFYPKDYFSKLIEWHQKLDADNVGAVIVTEVKNLTKKSASIKEVLSHKFGVGNSDFRTGVKELKEVDTVPFGCYKKEVFEKYGLYDERLIRNQDIELNKRIVNGGGKIYLIPDVKCTYFAREDFTSLAKNNYSNGYWNILTAYYTKTLSSLSLRHFIPLFFVLSLFIPVLGALINPKILWLSFFSLGSYLALVIIISIKINTNIMSIIYTIFGFLTLHFSYGFGSFIGLFGVLKKYIKGL